MMKIYICAIAKNEEKFVDRFMDSVKDADKVIVCDTGSTDKTVELLKNRGAEVQDIQVSPFRFDLARNLALMSCEEADIVICLDLDEIMLEGWREKIEKNWKEETTLMRYRMIFDWKDEKQTEPNITVWGVKIFNPKKYIWVDPIHENIKLREGEKESVVILDEHLMIHYPDPKKDRGSRIDLMKQFTKDEPTHDRASYVLGREYFNQYKYKEAEEELKRYLTLCIPYTEENRYSRSSACRMIGNSLIKQDKNINEVVTWFIRSVGENPFQREPWIYLGWAWASAGDYKMALACVNRGLAITDETQSIIKEEDCWGQKVEDLVNEIKKYE
jgi:glycosyltransferase involved in cell wall biosynthesis